MGRRDEDAENTVAESADEDGAESVDATAAETLAEAEAVDEGVVIPYSCSRSSSRSSNRSSNRSENFQQPEAYMSMVCDEDRDRTRTDPAFLPGYTHIFGHPSLYPQPLHDPQRRYLTAPALSRTSPQIGTVPRHRCAGSPLVKADPRDPMRQR